MGATSIRKTDITFVGRTLDIDTDGNFKLAGTAVTATAAELNSLDDYTGDTADLNLLDGVTATTAEINLLDGFVAAATINTTGKAAQVGGADSRVVKVVLQDLNGAAVAARSGVLAYISSDAEGIVAAGQTSLAISSTGAAYDVGFLIQLEQYKAYQLISSSAGDGVINVDISTSDTSSARYLNLILPDGTRVTSSLIVFTT